jgi:hypothetical protein
MQRNNTEVRLLIKGKPIAEYAHNGNVFVEGREGSEFEIEIINRNGFRIEAVLSVDGLSITDGKLASQSSSGYLVDANSTVCIPGWKLSDEQVASFFFSGKKQSYATQSTGSGNNNGVIGAMIFAEKFRTSYQPWQTVALGNPFPGSGILRSAGGYAVPSYTGITPFAGVTMTGSAVASGINQMSCSGANSVAVSAENSFEETVTKSFTNNIGTGFGEAQEYKTTAVQFERGDLVCMAVIYYDDSRGLKSRGISVGRGRARYAVQPQAFPGMNCTPPKGWEG